MAARRVIQLSLTYVPLLALWAIMVGRCATTAIFERDPTLRDQTIAGSAFIAISCLVFGWLCLSLPTVLCNKLVPLARFVWTLGFVTLLIHILIAFGVAHRWSHSAAVEHVRQVSGYGGGIVVNYLFTAVWLADVVWWWANPTSHAMRSRWIAAIIHGFLAFVVINATVIYGPPERRVLYGLNLAMTLLWCVGAPPAVRLLLKWSDTTNEPGLEPGSRVDVSSSADHSPT